MYLYIYLDRDKTIDRCYLCLKASQLKSNLLRDREVVAPDHTVHSLRVQQAHLDR